MKAIRFTITGELLVQLLHLPEGTQLIRARQVLESPHSCDLELIVTNDELPDVPEKTVIPQGEPMFSQCDGQTRFESWGLKG